MKKALFNKLWLLALLGIDALTKALALQKLPLMHGSCYPFGGVGVFENFLGVSFSLNVVSNTGAAWGIFPGHFSLLLSLRICVVAAIVIHLLFFRAPSRAQFPLWLIVGGALGNIIDMIYYGHVIDFFHFHLSFFKWSFPIFNVADSCITIGVALLLLRSNRRWAMKEV